MNRTRLARRKKKGAMGPRQVCETADATSTCGNELNCALFEPSGLREEKGQSSQKGSREKKKRSIVLWTSYMLPVLILEEHIIAHSWWLEQIDIPREGLAACVPARWTRNWIILAITDQGPEGKGLTTRDQTLFP